MIKRGGGLRTKLTFFYVWSPMKLRPQTSRTNGTNIHGGLIAEWYCIQEIDTEGFDRCN